jgi:hypothetical protein
MCLNQLGFGSCNVLVDGLQDRADLVRVHLLIVWTENEV